MAFVLEGDFEHVKRVLNVFSIMPIGIVSGLLSSFAMAL